MIQDADLFDVIERLPEGMKTSLGEGGGLVSGGESQRVRLGRSMLRGRARLAVLDEPFRGLDREKRRQLLQRARERWGSTTLICITHDVSEPGRIHGAPSTPEHPIARGRPGGD